MNFNNRAVLLLGIASCISAFSTVSVSTDYIESITIDVKPGSDRNCLNINGSGVIPVAILGGEDFDVAQVDQESLLFGGMSVRVRANRGAQCGFEYSNDDVYLDLVCKFTDDPANWMPGSDATASLTGQTFDGQQFEGVDTICIVPPRRDKPGRPDKPKKRK